VLAQLVTGPGNGLVPEVRIIEPGGGERTIIAYDPIFLGGVRVALGHVNGDGVTLTEIAGFFAYDESFIGGVWVAAGDISTATDWRTS
jgi:hypothetical protein